MRLIDAGQYAAALIALFTFFGMLIKWLVVLPIKTYIEKMTYPIQPNANGGKSLPDLVVSVNEVKALVHQHLEDHKK